MVNRIMLNETSYFGRGARSKIREEVIGRNFKKVLFVTDKVLLDNRVARMVTIELELAGCEYFIFDEVKANPNTQNVLNALQVARDNNVEAIVAVGGGSVIDTAKAVSIIMTNNEFEDVVSLDGVADTKNKGLPLICLPTTSGTAAEVTINYVITDEARTKKMVCVDPHDIPVVSIIDPDLMETMPQSLAASTGMDALTHAMEGYITKAAWLMTDMFHINAMSLIHKNIVEAANNKDRRAVEKMAYAQYIAGMGFSNVGLGIVHSMAHSLGAYFDTPHGVANAVLLPHVLRFNGVVCPDLFRNMGRAFNLNMENLSDTEAVEKVVEEIFKLNRQLNIPKNLQELNIPEDMLQTLAEQAINDACTPGNPRDVTVEDILNIYKEAWR